MPGDCHAALTVISKEKGSQYRDGEVLEMIENTGHASMKN